MIAEEKYIFKPETQRKIFILGAVGLLLFVLGVFLAMREGNGHGEGHEKKAATEISKSLTASVAPQEGHEEHKAEAGEEHHESPTWRKRIYTSLWQNNIFFTGIGIIGLFFVAIQYAAQAGWSAPIKRIPLAMGSWIPVAGVLMLVLWFVVKGDLFHWTHSDLYAKGDHFDKVLNGKSGFFYWPLAAGSFPIFFIGRMIIFFGLWYLFYTWIKKEMLAEDLDGSIEHWYSARKLSAIFLIIFAVSSSVSAWDWIMSIDTHWFSTMFGWYMFASWWVTGLSVITLIVVNLKDAGYLKMVNSNHLHDLGKFIFAFSIFWTYIWFGQFLLIYYANIPEETVYFISRMKTSPYSWIFYTNLILNFVLPFLLLMTRDAKRFSSMLKVVCTIVIIGHWFDFYNMVTPGVMKNEGGIGLLEIGLGMMFASAFIYVALNSLSKIQLVAKHHPFMEESLNHHI
ncbi:MAG: quinol:cytochrome C oxidoreductase [Bacteroidetes bacterium]|nr:quinol:cytochrome C oxidoreductase [Bacteroidota bacterium]